MSPHAATAHILTSHIMTPVQARVKLMANMDDIETSKYFPIDVEDPDHDDVTLTVVCEDGIDGTGPWAET